MRFTKIVLSFALLIFSFFFHGSFASYNEKCKSFFEEQSIFQLPLFKYSRELSSSKKTIEKTIPPKKENIQAIQNKAFTKKEILQIFFEHFHNRNIKQIEKIVLANPFLKKARVPFTNSDIKKEYHSLVPLGWTPLQMASYLKDLELLNLLLKLDFNLKTQKKQGGISREDNPLHIAIKRNFSKGAESILNHVSYVELGAQKNRFIDEKTQDKNTPWALAIQHYEKYKDSTFIHLIGKYAPSGYVESYSWDGPKDGYKLAQQTGSQRVIQLANRYLVAPNYEYYQHIKRNSGSFFQKRTKQPYYH